MSFGSGQDYDTDQSHHTGLSYHANQNYNADLDYGAYQQFATPTYSTDPRHDAGQNYEAGQRSGWGPGHDASPGFDHDEGFDEGRVSDYSQWRGGELSYAEGYDRGWGFDDGRVDDSDANYGAAQSHHVAWNCDDARNSGVVGSAEYPQSAEPGMLRDEWSTRSGGSGSARDVGRWPTADRADSHDGSQRLGGRKRRGGAHRVPAPPKALRGRVAVVAVAAGAIVAAGQNLAAETEQGPQTGELQAVGQQRALEPMNGELAGAPELLDLAAPTDLGQFSDVLENGSKFAQDLAAEAEANLRPLFTKFASGAFTSGYGQRWGVLHPGVDVAAPIGTPIYAVEDGTVIDAGPAAGFGMWVRVRGDDGTVTVYGHINTALVSVGEHVLAGDEIATVGNRGESTGPHCHFEVWLNGTDRIDPVPWLATRGISLGTERD
ncbi:M23 family metallopeptidase [Nocardia sp. CA-129566]|uniref:M23 family metallopeptidase n=1 Tax=Nocardia sp. CA-129566 TaxID=3239976 RepID=UPI003D979DD2